MAKSTTFQTKQNSKVVIGTEVTMGTATLAAGTTLEMPVTDFSFSESYGHTLVQAPARIGKGGMTQSDKMVKWQHHDKMFDISITFHGSKQAIDRACLALYGDGDGTNALTGDMPDITSYQHGVGNVRPVTLWFENASHLGEGTDMIFKSCLCTGLTMTADIASNGGVVMCTATFVTGYEPTEAALTFTGGTHTLLTAQTSIFNMHDLSTTTLDGEDILLYGFDISITRPVNRIGFDADNGYQPMGYSVGQYEVTGNINCKRDGEVVSAIDNSGAMALVLDTGVFQITGEKVYVDNSGISMDDDGWKQTIPLRFTYNNAATTNPVITIHTVAD